jgi:hypothetical protein
MRSSFGNRIGTSEMRDQQHFYEADSDSNQGYSTTLFNGTLVADCELDRKLCCFLARILSLEDLRKIARTLSHDTRLPGRVLKLKVPTRKQECYPLDRDVRLQG